MFVIRCQANGLSCLGGMLVLEGQWNSIWKSAWEKRKKCFHLGKLHFYVRVLWIEMAKISLRWKLVLWEKKSYVLLEIPQGSNLSGAGNRTTQIQRGPDTLREDEVLVGCLWAGMVGWLKFLLSTKCRDSVKTVWLSGLWGHRPEDVGLVFQCLQMRRASGISLSWSLSSYCLLNMFQAKTRA